MTNLVFKKERIVVPENCHYYHTDGTPCLEVPAKKGGTKEPNIVDAKKYGLLPGVTAINKIKANHTIVRWKEKNAIQCTINLIKELGIENITPEMCLVAADSTGGKAAERGTRIHENIERLFRGEDVEDEISKAAFVNITNLFKDIGIDSNDISLEHSFANIELGYGGKIDLKTKDDRFVFDWKTYEGKRDYTYDSEQMQGAAYIRGLGSDISRSKFMDVVIDCSSGSIYPIELTNDEYQKGIAIFLLLSEIWRIEKKYDPRTNQTVLPIQG